ncbi:hypothetical protein WN48_09678 [Eufriesea mexicana]|uniref:Uncharacterized protein n=1 Tax=Eufriesea mexicana TaxID=516756 RepID=A0A310SF15_9HYME|nr:hypothetical protein WN48_09678 [Eufriesea mexicana]
MAKRAVRRLWRVQHTGKVNTRSLLKRNIDSRPTARESCHPYSCSGRSRRNETRREEKKEKREERKGGESGNEGAARTSLLAHHRQNRPPVANRASIQRPTTFLWSTKKASLGVPVSFRPQTSSQPRSTMLYRF